jgi:hypothetical protein
MLANDTTSKKLKKKPLNQIEVVNVYLFVLFFPFFWSYPLGPFGSIKRPTTNGWNLQPFLCKIMELLKKNQCFFAKNHQDLKKENPKKIPHFCT